MVAEQNLDFKFSTYILIDSGEWEKKEKLSKYVFNILSNQTTNGQLTKSNIASIDELARICTDFVKYLLKCGAKDKILFS